jgi:hypothetical protein
MAYGIIFVSGTVRDCDGYGPARGALVQLLSPSGAVIGSDRAGVDGSFIIRAPYQEDPAGTPVLAVGAIRGHLPVHRIYTTWNYTAQLRAECIEKRPGAKQETTVESSADGGDAPLLSPPHSLYPRQPTGP